MKLLSFGSGLMMVLLVLPNEHSVSGQVETGRPGASSPMTFTTKEDHQNMLGQLGITKLRPGPSGNDADPHHANYDESSANPFPHLPEVLRLKNGDPVTTAEMWWQQRRPEIVEDFEREVVGRVPVNVPAVTWTVVETRELEVGGKLVVEKQLQGVVDNSACPSIEVKIAMTLSTPKDAEGPVPVLMMFGGFGFGSAVAEAIRQRVASQVVSASSRKFSQANAHRRWVGLCHARSVQHPSRPWRWLDTRHHWLDQWRVNRASLTIGARCGPGHGAHHGAWTTWKRTPPWMQNGWESRASRDTARRRWSLWPLNRDSLWPWSAPRVKVVPSSTAGILVKQLRI